MRISDWSSDVCSSDLFSAGVLPPPCHGCRRPRRPTLKGPRRPSQEAAMAAVRALATTLVAPLVAAAITAAPATAQDAAQDARNLSRSEEHTSELQSLMRISYAVFCLNTKKTTTHNAHN